MTADISVRIMTCVILIAFFGLSLPSCADENIYLPSSLNKHKKSLDGQEVTLRGYLIHESAQYAVWDSAEARDDEDVSKCISLLYVNSMRERILNANRHYVTVKGVFQRNVTKGGGVYSGLCNYTGVTVSEIIEDSGGDQDQRSQSRMALT